MAVHASYSFCQDYSSLIEELDKTLDSKDSYILLKQKSIQKKKDTLQTYKVAGNLSQQIEVSLDLVNEYQSFVYDSAQLYVNKAKELAIQINNVRLISQIKIRQGFVLLSAGLFREAMDTLKSVNRGLLNDSLKSILYATLARTYYDIADYVGDPVYRTEYIARGNVYIDSALIFAAPNTNEFWAIKSLERMKMSDWLGAKQVFEYWMNNYTLSMHQYAIATSSLAYIYHMTGYSNLAIEYFTRAAINDVKYATMETVALRNLANLFYEKGEEKRAYRYITEALNQASYYNARHRQFEIGQILPIIDRGRMDVIQKQRDKIGVFSIFISVFLVALIIALIVNLISFRRLSLARHTIRKQNDNLIEANKIKDEYIANFFNQNSEYIEKIENLQKWVSRMVATKQFNMLKKIPEHINIQHERDILYERFDKIFLKLFPNFVKEFNSLLIDGEQIQLKDNQLLNPDLRIYAMIRIGIQDNEKIASFLNYSVNTIYTYKTKMKNKAKCSPEQFNQKIMEIKSI
jgi:tetratricopeptide (TPR) repeat protein